MRVSAHPAVVRFSGLSSNGAAFGRFAEWSVSRVKRQGIRFRQFLASVGRVKREMCGFSLIRLLFGFHKCSRFPPIRRLFGFSGLSCKGGAFWQV